jgi:hypothetical protein
MPFFFAALGLLGALRNSQLDGNGALEYQHRAPLKPR